MKISFDPGDVVYYEGKAATILGPPVKANGVPGYHVRDAAGSLHLVPANVLKILDTHLLELCTELLLKHDQWEKGLAASEEDTLLESMSPETYGALSELQAERTAVLMEVAAARKIQAQRNN